jgi:HK97 family phage portal protein
MEQPRAGLLRRLARVVRGAFKRTTDLTSDDLMFWGNMWASPSLTGIQINQQAALMVPTVMACVSMIAEDIAKMTPALWRAQPDGSMVKESNHYLAKLLLKPNGWQTWSEFCIQMMAALLLRGNAYAIIVRDGHAVPLYWVAINPDRVALWQSPDGSLFWMVTRGGLHELAVLRAEPLLIPYEDVMHWKGLSGSGLVGASKIVLNREAIALALGQEQLAARTMGSGAKPSGVLTTDQKLTPEAAERVRDDWNRLNSTLANSGRTAILEQGLKFEPITLKMTDIEFLKSRDFQILDIARIWRVPPHMLGVDIVKSVATNLAQQAQEYRNYTLGTYETLIEERFTFTYDLPPDLRVKLDSKGILRADINTRYEANRIGLQGWLTTNEVRREEGLPPLADPLADQVWKPVNTAPTSSPLFSQPPQTDKPAGVGSEQGGENEGAGRPKKTAPTPVSAPAD